MGLIPIPIEELAKPVKKRNKISLLQRVRTKLHNKTLSMDNKILINSCTRLADFICTKKKHNLEDLKKLLNNLERSILIIQKSKKTIVEKDAKKIKRLK